MLQISKMRWYVSCIVRCAGQRSIEFLAAQGVDTVIELGAGKVLSGLIKRINKELNTASVTDVASLKDALAAE